MNVGDSILVECNIIELGENGSVKLRFDDAEFWVTLEKTFEAEPLDGYRSALSSETINPGDVFWSSRDEKIHLVNFTAGMTCKEAVERGDRLREKWIFFKPLEKDLQQ